MSAVELGLIGLGVMGRNLALNVAERGFRVAGFEPLATELSVTAEALDGQFRVYPTLDALVTALQPPRALLLMVSAGEPVDRLLDQLFAVVSRRRRSGRRRQLALRRHPPPARALRRGRHRVFGAGGVWR